MQTSPDLISQVLPYILPTLLTLWVLGVVSFFLYHWIRQASVMDNLVYASEPATQLQRELVSIARAVELKHIPHVRISDDKAGPLVTGFIRPVVILPHNFMTDFSPTQRHYILMHEFMHIKRGDIWVALAWLGFRALNWPNPLVHYAAKHFRSDQEAACDASVLSAMGDSQSAVTRYAETIIHAAKTAMMDGSANPQPSQLALTIHHPLKERLMILGTHRKTSIWRSRMAASAMIIGAACISAPFVQADNHPEEELAGKPETYTNKSVIKRTYIKDGKEVSEHYEISIDDDIIKAYKVGPFGKKTQIELEDIEGVDIDDLKADYKRFPIRDDEGVKFMSREDFKEWAETEYPKWKEEDFESWVEGDFTAWASTPLSGKLTMRDENGKTHFEFKDFPQPPKPPLPPKISKLSENVFVFESDDPEGHKVIKKLKSLKGLEKLKALKSLESLKGLGKLEALKSLESLKELEELEVLEGIEAYETFSIFTDEDENLDLEFYITQSKLAAALAMLEDTRVKANDSRKIVKAKRELEKARKALKAAEQAFAEQALEKQAIRDAK